MTAGIIRDMSETPDQSSAVTDPVGTPVVREEPGVVEPKGQPSDRSRLYQVTAWVGIVAGTVFIVAVIFFSGFALGRGGGPGPDHGPRPGPGSSEHGPWGMHAPGMIGPGGGPGMFGPRDGGPGGPGGPGAGQGNGPAPGPSTPPRP